MFSLFQHADTTLAATRMEAGQHVGLWHIRIVDTFSGTSAETYWTDDQFAAVAFLMHANDADNEMSRLAYAIAEPLFVELPKEIRCMP